MRTLPALLIAILAASCSKHEAPPPAPAPAAIGSAGAKPAPAPVPVVADAAVAAGSATSVAKAGPGSAADRAPLTPEQRAAPATFRASMKLGRAATDKKAYADAIAAFDAALKARANEPHALAERGFAKLLAATDLDAASADFDHAADATRDPKLLAMIWFNRGLTDDKLGHADAALVDYYLANQLVPSKAAAAKLAGKTVCPLRISSAKEIPSDPPVDAADWLALLDAVYPMGDDAPKTSDDARAWILNTREKPALPVGVVIGADLGKTALVVGSRTGGALRAVSVAQEPGGRCPGDVGAVVLGAQGSLVYVRALEEVGGGMTELCHTGSGDDGVVAECTGADDEQHQGTACDQTGVTIRDVVVDLATGKRLIVAEQPAPIAPGDDGVAALKLDDARLVQAKLAADGLHLTGLGCDQVIALPPK